MDIISFTIKFLIVLFFFLAMIRIWMIFASHIGENLGLSKFFLSLCNKIKLLFLNLSKSLRQLGMDKSNKR